MRTLCKTCVKHPMANPCGLKCVLKALCAQVFFGAEAGPTASTSALSGTHLLLWLPHFHDFCLTVGILGCGTKARASLPHARASPPRPCPGSVWCAWSH